MTRILKLSMKGFKSFGDRTDIVYGDRFNCILGPNGAGKSNVLDSLCFVLGKGSAKGLRAEKSANLIYNGGKTKNPAKEGEVSIYFDNRKKEFPISKRFGMKGETSHEPKNDDDWSEEIKISRVILATGQSKYKINDKVVTRQQVLDLMSIAKINPDGYNIVLQGDIVRLVEMSPVERRGIIEEISGISIYESKKNKAISDLTKVEQSLGDAEIILKEREHYLRELKQDRDAALKYKKLKERSDSNHATYTHIQIKKKDNQIEAFNKHMTENEAKIKKHNEVIAEQKKVLDEKQKAVEDINKEVEEKGEKDQIAIHKEVEELKVRIGTNKSLIENNKNELTRIETRKDQLESNLKEIDEKLISLEVEKNDSLEVIKKTEEEKAQFEGKIAAFKKKNKLDDSDNIELEVEKIDKVADEKQKVVLEFREKQQDFLRQKDKIEYKIEAIDTQMEKVLEIEKENKSELEKLKQKRKEFKKATLELNTLLNEDSSLGAQLSNARNKLLIANESLSKIKIKSISISEALGQRSGVKHIIDNKSKFSGVHGLVSEVGKVSTKYAQALEIAAGAKIKSIVVEDDGTASKCIKFLKEKRLGTATFVPMNKIKAIKIDSALRSLKESRGAHGFAIDLVSYEPKFNKVFSYVFGNTLVVDSIDVARRIGVGKVRMVTLDGDLVEFSGAMHGGYRRKERGGIGFQEKEVADQQKKFEKESMDLSALVANIQSKRAGNEDKITSLREFKANIEGEIITMEKSLHIDTGDLEASKRQKQLLNDELKIVDKKLNEFMGEISKQNSELAHFKIKKAELRAKIAQLKNPRLLAELNSFEQKKSQLAERKNEFDNKISSIEMQVNSIILPEKENIAKILKQNIKELGAFKTESETLEKQIKADEKNLKVKEVEEKKFYQKFKLLFNKRNKISDEIREHEKKLLTKEENIRTLEQKNNFTSIENARVKSELMTLNEQFKKYKDVPLHKSKNEQQLKKEISEFEKMMENMGNVNMRALEVYDNVEKEYKKQVERKEKLAEEKGDVMMMINEIETRKKELFMKTFNAIYERFTTIFNELNTKGRTAELLLDNKEDPLEGGLTIRVRITGKKFLDIRSLSGGEKTMTALSFLFAVQEYQPSSFYVLDEVDAALDKHNSERLSKLIREYTRNAQYVIISHNDAIISEADNLYGVSMNEHGMTKVTSLKL